MYKRTERDRGEPPAITTFIVIKIHFSAMNENDNNKKQHLLQHKEKTKIPKKLTQTNQRAKERRQVLQQYSWISPEEWLMALPEETSIHTAKMPAIKIALKEIHKRLVIYRLLGLYAVHQIQRKSPDVKLDMLNPNTTQKPGKYYSI